jgi:hypothetical protein
MNLSKLLRCAGLALFVAFALTAGAQVAQAAAVKLKVAVIHARKQPGPQDPALARIQGQLQKAFAAYKSFKELDLKEFELEPGKRANMPLPGNKSARFHYQGPDQKVHRVKLKIGENELDLRIPEKRLFFQAGLKHQDGMLVLAIYLR